MRNAALIGAALLGAASGARSFSGIGVLAALGNAGPQGRPAAVLDHRVGRPALMAAALAEMAADKLPQAPARTELPGLASRMVCAAACGLALAFDETQPAELVDDDRVTMLPVRRAVDLPSGVAAVAVAVAAAGLSAWGGVRWRSYAGERFGRDWPGAVLEDVAAVGLAVGAWRTARH